MRQVLQHCHSMECGGHFGGQRTIEKVLQAGFYYPTLFKDAQSFVKLAINAKERETFPIRMR